MKNSLLLPVLIGAAVAGAVGWFLISEDTAEIRDELSESLCKRLDSLQNKLTGPVTDGSDFAEDYVKADKNE